MERIKRELTALQGVSIHVGILGDAGSDILMIAGVHMNMERRSVRRMSSIWLFR